MIGTAGIGAWLHETTTPSPPLREMPGLSNAGKENLDIIKMKVMT